MYQIKNPPTDFNVITWQVHLRFNLNRWTIRSKPVNFISALIHGSKRKKKNLISGCLSLACSLYCHAFKHPHQKDTHLCRAMRGGENGRRLAGKFQHGAREIERGCLTGLPFGLIWNTSLKTNFWLFKCRGKVITLKHKISSGTQKGEQKQKQKNSGFRYDFLALNSLNRFNLPFV